MARRNINTVIRRNNRNEATKRDRKMSSSVSQTFVPPNEPEEKLYFPNDDYDTDIAPGYNSILKIIISLRISSAFYGLIMDCDEVYNYWEPLHLFLYGNGLQTWEYSPLYAIRSYFYIFLHSLPAQLIINISPHSKIFIFYSIRCILGIISASADTLLYYALCKKFANSIGIIYIVFTLLAPGMFISSTAFLPSSFSMILCTLTIAAYLREKFFIAIFCTAISALLGWPFAAVLGFPLVIHMVFIYNKKYLLKFIIYAGISGLLISVPMIYFDSLYFGKTVFAPLNIVLYNVFSSHGPDLYGTAPLTYYLKNLFLNWNIAFPLLFLSIPLSWLEYNKIRNEKAKDFKKINYESFIPLLLLFCTLMLWFIIFFSQPHKEERFMFPVYSLIAILAAVAVDGISKMFKNSTVVILIILGIFGGFSVTRNIALTKYYSAPITIFKEFNDYMIEHSKDLDFSVMQDPVNLCMGDEWYEFPSSFFLPYKVVDRFNRKRSVKLQFIKSGFKGLLPKYYEQGKLLDVTRKIPSYMNDKNEEEPSRYISLSSCDYLVKLNKNNNNYKELSNEFVPIIRQPYLDTDKTSSIFRAFYTPLYSDEALHWASYEILKHR
ncbi:Alpha-1,2-mannosyltransferase ALG9 [Strongyloides ratti]|uniref:Mannosyltransferase n=1 Tax=Strongyloides ratti TaxID=34506 RepID=A0A090KU38_STRRB|nr:Alpha-1,2-mannosyltransferase ALG9 [Strongyloides ratti]CEF60936.1 Alpha-1,2-mannosyltransferase ALG9 [Strongyloides ratti]